MHAPVRSDDDLADVARTFNRLVDAQEAAQRDLDQYRVLVEGTSDTCAVLDGDARLRLVNRAYAERLGETPEAIEGRLFSEVVGKRAFANIADAHAACMAGEARTFEVVREDPELGPRNLMVRYYPIESGPEREHLVGAIATDITELKRAQADYAVLFDAIPDGVLLLRDGRHILDCSARVAEDFGWSREWLIGREIIDISPELQPDGRPSAEKAVELVDAAARSGTQRFEWEFVRGDGHRAITEVVIGPVVGAGQADAFAIGHDVTEERRVRADRKQKQRLIEASEDGFCIIDIDYRYTFATERYAALFGLDRATLEGKHLPEVLSRDLFDREFKPPIDRALAGEPQNFEAEHKCEDAGTRQFLVRYYPLPATDGTVTQVGGVVTDITDLKQAEAQLRKQQRLLDLAMRSARMGGWSIDLASGAVEWSDTVAEIHGMPAGYAPTIEERSAFYAPQWRERMRALFTACAEHGESYDEELQIIAADGKPAWVRTTGVPVRDNRGSIVRVEGALQDVSERREREWKLRQMVHIVEQSPAAIVVTDIDGCIEYVNASAEAVSGYTSDELIGATPAVFQSGGAAWETIQAGGVWQGEIQNRRKDGALYCEYEYISPITDDAGRIVHYVAIKEDISERKRIEDELRASRDQLASAVETRQALINALPAHIALLDADGRIIDVNERWRAFGCEHANSDPDFGIGSNYIAVCETAAVAAGPDGDDEGAAAVAAGLRSVLGGEHGLFACDYPCHSPTEQQWFRMIADRLHDDASAAGQPGPRAVVMHIDITERKRAEQAITRIAYQDPLTELASRQGFTETVNQWWARQGWQPHARVVMLDVHRLRDVNETYGFDAGDELLIAIARRLEASSPDGTVVGRAGGDEFMIFLPAASTRAADAACSALTAVFAEPFPVAGSTFECHASFGYTRLGPKQRDPDDLLREAEIALFYASAPQAPNEWRGYASELEERSQERIRITAELRRALARDEFELQFQPKVDLATGELIGAEALLRWAHPEWGLQLPGLFVSIAEQSQLIGPIGNWVLHEACRCLRAWQDGGLDLGRLSVNVSVVQFAGGDLPQIVEQALTRNGVAPSALTLEITESVFEQNANSLHRQLHELHAMGVHLSLDDFGTGYSSLLYLKKYPFDEIKIDKGFVTDMTSESYKNKVVASVVTIAEALGASVVAEGVETREVADALVAMRCRIGQGFYYSIPLAPNDFEWLLMNRTSLPLRGA